MTSDQLRNLDYDLCAALENNSVNLPSPVAVIMATIEGENDFADWHWIVLLEDGQHAYITGGCDYTGWDCQSNCEAFVEPDLESALRHVGEAQITELREKCVRSQSPS